MKTNISDKAHIEDKVIFISSQALGAEDQIGHVLRGAQETHTTQELNQTRSIQLKNDKHIKLSLPG